MKKISIDAPLVALGGLIILAGGMLITSSVTQIGSIYRTIAQEAPAESQLAQVGGGGGFGNEVKGWAWSSNVGWISFNSTDAGAGGGPYKVSISTTTANPTLGKFGGYAWSPNVGWISFNSADVSGCPEVGTLDGCNPAVSLTSGAVTGYARVLSMKNESGDGWVQLSGTNHPSASGDSSGVTFNTSTKDFTGYAWEPTALGWILVDAKLDSVASVQSGLQVTCSSSAAPSNTVAAGASVTFTANVTGGTSPYSYTWGSCGTNSNTCAVTYGASGTGPSLTVTDSTSPTALSKSPSPSCPVITVNTTSSGTNLFIGSNISTTKTSHSLRQGNIFALSWTDAPTDYDSCELTISNGGNGYWTNAIDAVSGSGAQAGNIAGLLTAVSSGVQRGNYTFTRTCHDAEALLPPQPSTATLRIVGASGEEF
ncbi:MAG: hypothetical protein AAB381_02345 [Patescibacteria group bacterium]